MTDTDNEDGPRNTEAPDFETSLEQLESLVQAMEDGELSLEQSLEAFEKGIRLTRECQKALQEAEQKVQYLLGEDDTPRDDEQ